MTTRYSMNSLIHSIDKTSLRSFHWNESLSRGVVENLWKTCGKLCGKLCGKREGVGQNELGVGQNELPPNRGEVGQNELHRI